MKLKKILITTCSLLSIWAYADSLKALDAFMQNTSMAANFTQTVYGNKKNKVSQGLMQIERPNRFRWEYIQDGQLIVSNGKDIYIYDKPLQQVTQKNLNSSLGKSPALLLAGGNDIKKYYTINAQPESGGLEWVSLVPKSVKDNNGFKSVTMGFNKNTQLLSQMNFTDNFDNKSNISFSNVKVGAKVPASTFIFTPPTGVDVIKADN